MRHRHEGKTMTDVDRKPATSQMKQSATFRFGSAYAEDTVVLSSFFRVDPDGFLPVVHDG